MSFEYWQLQIPTRFYSMYHLYKVISSAVFPFAANLICRNIGIFYRDCILLTDILHSQGIII